MSRSAHNNRASDSYKRQIARDNLTHSLSLSRYHVGDSTCAHLMTDTMKYIDTSSFIRKARIHIK